MCYEKLIPKVDKFLFRFWYKFFGGLVIRYEHQRHLTKIKGIKEDIKMRLMLKKISVFAMALLIAFTSLGGGFKAYAAEVDTTIEKVVEQYMEAREKFLKSGNVKKLEKIAVVGIVNDEGEHCDLLDELGIKIKKSEYEIESVKDNETHVEVDVVEKLTYSKEGQKSECETMHSLCLMKDSNDAWWVVSDSYFEEVTEFISCSYVPEGGIATFALADTSNVAIISVAKTQIGYKEKASNSNLDSFTANAGDANYTKYGKWYGSNPDPWCAMFVSWCANEAGYSQSMFPKYSSCDTGMNYFKSVGRFYSSKAYGGTYTPKAGDIFFWGKVDSVTKNVDATHTGIVVSVNGENMTVIDGNHNDQVCQREMSISNSGLLGFATSCIHNGGTVQKYNVSYHWNACKICNAVIGLKTVHTFNTLGKCKLCPATQMSTAALSVSLLHE